MLTGLSREAVLVVLAVSLGEERFLNALHEEIVRPVLQQPLAASLYLRQQASVSLVRVGGADAVATSPSGLGPLIDGRKPLGGLRRRFVRHKLGGVKGASSWLSTRS